MLFVLVRFEVADSGLQVLSEFLQKLLSGPSTMNVAFFKQYYFLILQDPSKRT